MKTLAGRGAPVCQRTHKRLRDIVGVDVVHGFHSQIGQ